MSYTEVAYFVIVAGLGLGDVHTAVLYIAIQYDICNLISRCFLFYKLPRLVDSSPNKMRDSDRRFAARLAVKYKYLVRT